MSKRSPSWHVMVNGQPHAIVTKSESGIYWVKDVPETTLTMSGAHWVTHSAGADLHFDLYRDKRKWDHVTLSDCQVKWVTVGPAGATFALSGYPEYAIVPIDRSIRSLEHSVLSGVTSIRPDVSGELVVALYRPSSCDPKWIARTSSSGP